MKRLISLFLIALFAGCDRSPPLPSRTLSGADGFGVTIKVVTIEGHDYILATYAGHGVSICPKTP